MTDHARPSRRVATMVAVLCLLVVAGCAEVDPEVPPPASPTPSLDDVLHAFPDRLSEDFPDVFPEFPDGTRLIQIEYSDEPAQRRDQDGIFEVGTNLRHHRTGAYHGTGSDDDYDTVLDFYRTTLPEAGWDVTNEMTPPGETDRATLSFTGHDLEGVLYLTEEGGRVLIRASLVLHLPDLDPYADFGPHVPLPDWYAEGMPALPDRAARVLTKLTYSTEREEPIGLGVSYRLTGEVDDDDFDNVTDHIRTATPRAGWSLLDEEHEDTAHDTEDGPIERRVTRLHFSGYGSLLRVSVNQTTQSDGTLTPVLVGLQFQAGRAADR